MTRVVRFLAIVGFAFLGTARAGELAPDLADLLGRAAPDAQIPAIVMMARQADIKALNTQLDAGNATRATRNRLVLTELELVARETQPQLQPMIDAFLASGAMAECHAVTIINAFCVRAQPVVLRALASHEATGTIWYSYPIETIRPVGPEVPSPVSAGTTPEVGLTGIKADFLWNLGIMGQGRIVSDIDTGARGTHTAFASRWRGLQPGVLPAHAWFDPVTNTTFPTDANGHGTHTLGTICGDSGTGLEIVGVARQAQWIAAGVIDRVSIPTTVADAIRAFNWQANPDGNLATAHDVPDSSSNSWGLVTGHGYPPCDPTIWASIDNSEAAGVIVVFAAGNEGTGGIRRPGDRQTTPTNTYAVGALNVDQTTIASFSSRGPSGCPGAPIKPEICAHGNSVRSSTRTSDTSYGLLSGTSMATPHIAGAVTLLRQVHPNGTPDLIKNILMTTADDLGTVGEDNTFGFGRANLQSAYNALIAARPPVSVSVVTDTRVIQRAVGGFGYYLITLINYTNVNQFVRASIVMNFNSNPLITVLGTLDFVVPASYSNDASPARLAFPFPANMPVGLIGNYELVATIRNPGNNAIISQASASVTYAGP
jgi:bacillopeptidase F